MTRSAIPQADAIALHEAGVSAARSGDWLAALELLERAVAAAPSSAAVFNDRGVVLKALKRWEAALGSFERAIELQCGYAAAYNNRANVLRELCQFEAALDSYDRAIEADPGYADAYNNRGVLLIDLGRWEAALASFDRAIAAQPAHANAHCNRGVALERLDRLEDALGSYERAIALDARFAQAYSNRGNLLRQLQRLDEALASCNRALELSPHHAEAHQNKAIASLLLGDMQSAWQGYEWRWKNEKSALFSERNRFSQPLWLGQQALAQKRILVHSEQGLGDTLQFCRYVKLVADMGATVILEVPSPLYRLLSRLEGVYRVIARGDPLPDFDVHCPMMSLPLALGNRTLADVPARVPYLSCAPEDALLWAQRLGRRTKPRVGLVWSGGFRPDQPEVWSVNKRRNIPLAKFAPLRDPRLEFFSLQKGEAAEAELAELTARGWVGPPIVDFTVLLRDFSDTAALIGQLDLVISVDTSTAHLAGALGKPVWILNRFDSCWRWLLDRSDSPWYPTATIYRQKVAGDWDSMIERVAADLAGLAN